MEFNDIDKSDYFAEYIVVGDVLDKSVEFQFKDTADQIRTVVRSLARQ